ncbi:MAG: AMP-dependent synthetase and ligase [Candidatus Dadabacteria bacterium CSP1-2]|nr:MAG: AMP-dependent synthetase and ligase [Candidatus Dadabacteria bacterium CSP1-2]
MASYRELSSSKTSNIYQMKFNYENLCSSWKWEIPTYFNIGRDCTDRHAKSESHGNKIALYWESEEGEIKRFTFAELSSLTNQIGNALLSLGFQKGDRLLIRLPNLPEFPLVFLGAIKIGAVPIPSSTMLTAEEIDYLLDDSKSKGVITTPELYEAVEVNRGHHKKFKYALIVGRPIPSACVDFTELINKCSENLSVDETKADDVAYICYTSGTTGFPKGVVHAQRALIGHDPAAQYWQALKPDDVVMHAGRLNWTYTLGTGCLDPWRHGCSTVIYGGEHNPKKFFELITKYRVNVFMAVPTVYRQMLRVSDEIDCDLSSLRHALSAGEHLSEELFHSWKNELGVELYDGLGMSELSYYLSNMPGMPIKPGSPGKPQPGHRSTLIDEVGKEVRVGEIGVLATPKDDPGIMIQYWEKPDETENMFRGNRFVSGDFFYKDEDGYFWLVGREDDIITTFGYRVSPFEVERVLSDHPVVHECAVTGIELEEDKTITTAFVVLKDSRHELERLKQELLDYSHRRLARYKCPKEIVFIDSIPKTANGKIKRKVLREAYSLF